MNVVLRILFSVIMMLVALNMSWLFLFVLMVVGFVIFSWYIEGFIIVGLVSVMVATGQPFVFGYLIIAMVLALIVGIAKRRLSF